MNLYLLERTDKIDYDQFDSFVVRAPSEKEARQMLRELYVRDRYTPWTKDDDNVQVELLGKAESSQGSEIVLGSFNAG